MFRLLVLLQTLVDPLQLRHAAFSFEWYSQCWQDGRITPVGQGTRLALSQIRGGFPAAIDGPRLVIWSPYGRMALTILDRVPTTALRTGSIGIRFTPAPQLNISGLEHDDYALDGGVGIVSYSGAPAALTARFRESRFYALEWHGHQSACEAW